MVTSAPAEARRGSKVCPASVDDYDERETPMSLDGQFAVADMISEQYLRPDLVGGGVGRVLIDALNSDQLDSLPFGAIQVDARGTVLQFNAYEARLAGFEKSKAIGKNFFTEIAPCTDVKEFRGRFTDGVARKQLHERFQYHFAFKQEPRDVTITLYYSELTGSTWIFIRPV
jgi:photoactive yellow protein